jgi:hypothetical protein
VTPRSDDERQRLRAKILDRVAHEDEQGKLLHEKLLVLGASSAPDPVEMDDLAERLRVHARRAKETSELLNLLDGEGAAPADILKRISRRLRDLDDAQGSDR